MTLVVGEIKYTNILPLFYYLDREKLAQQGCTFVTQIPAELNAAMSKGMVSLGGISSFAYGENKDKYHLLPNLSVSAHGSVGSIFLFSKVPIDELKGKKVALTSSSATSVNLLKIILKKFYQLTVTYEVMNPNYEQMMAEHDACLLIGDDAIVTKWRQEKDTYCYDLGELWYKHTGFPMTFAVLAVRNDVIEKDESLLFELYKQLVDSKKKSIEDDFRPMISSIQSALGGTTEYWHKYFSGLCYDFGKKQQEGLTYYYQLAHELGLLKHPVDSIAVWDVYQHSE